MSSACGGEVFHTPVDAIPSELPRTRPLAVRRPLVAVAPELVAAVAVGRKLVAAVAAWSPDATVRLAPAALSALNIYKSHHPLLGSALPFACSYLRATTRRLKSSSFELLSYEIPLQAPISSPNPGGRGMPVAEYFTLPPRFSGESGSCMPVEE